MPTPRELAAHRNSMLNLFGDYSTLSQLGQMGGQIQPIAQMSRLARARPSGSVRWCRQRKRARRARRTWPQANSHPHASDVQPRPGLLAALPAYGT